MAAGLVHINVRDHTLYLVTALLESIDNVKLLQFAAN